DGGLILLLVLPWLLLACDTEWIFANRIIDAWYYTGYYLDLMQHLRNFPDLYYSSRLSTLLVGHAVYQVLPPVAANYALHLGLYYVTVLSVYRVLSLAVGRRAGLLASLMLGC